ncbi:MAG: hypothetical protein AAGD25_23505 [Cyanobacteria bacterium P01_F01_bin.150]
MKIAYLKPTFPDEKRVGLLPQHLIHCHPEDERRFEAGYGTALGIPDEAYGNAGGYTRKSLFEWADVLYCIKVPQPDDYKYFKEGQGLVGWIHPFGASGRGFLKNCGQPKKLWLFDVTNRISIRYYNQVTENLMVPRDITRRNSILAGYASTMHAAMLRGGITQNDQVALFGTGNIAFGAYKYLSQRGIEPLLRRRSNSSFLRHEFRTLDIFINCVEIADGDTPIVTDEMLASMKSSGWVIDAAADTGRAISGTRATKINAPIYQDSHGHTFYVVDNSPTLLYRESSEAVSEGYSKHFWSKPMQYWYGSDCIATDADSALMMDVLPDNTLEAKPVSSEALVRL